jgi:proteic killer suppression protein
MIKSFADKRTVALFEGRAVKAVPREVAKRARAKLVMIADAVKLEDLRVPPGNRLEVLKGRRTGQLSIRINDQWRICFVWREGAAYEVEFVDYH